MNSSKQLKISLTCYSVVSTNFALFSNEINRGPNFKWSNFPDMMARNIKSTMWMTLKKPSNKDLVNDMEELASNTCKEIASHLVSLSGKDENSN